MCPPRSLRVRWVAAVVLREKEACRPHASPQLSAPEYLRQRCIADEADKIEVRLLKAEQANCWRIVAATAPVKRPRISIIGYRVAFGEGERLNDLTDGKGPEKCIDRSTRRSW